VLLAPHVAGPHGDSAGFHALARVSILRRSGYVRQPRTLLLVIGVLSGCSHPPPHHPGEEQLTAVEFEGNKQLGKNTLLTGLALHRTLQRGGAPDPYLVQIDEDRIRGEYLRKGYLDIDVRSRVERKGEYAKVIYTVEEGERANTRIAITGLPPEVKPADVRAMLPLQDGKPFDYEAYDLAKPKLLGVVQDAGYARARLEASVIADRADHKAVVELEYTPGPKCRFGEVKITGAKGDLASSVRDRITFKPGQQYSTQAITQTQRNLYGFGRFSTVRVTPDQGGGEVVGVEVAVAEGAPHELKLGGGFGIDPTSYEVRGRVGYSVAGWPFPLDTTTLDLRPAYAYIREDGSYEPRVRALAKIERLDLFWAYTKAEVGAGYNYLTLEAFTSYGPLARLGFETPLGSNKLKLRVGWNFEQLGFRRISDLVDADLQHRLGIDRSARIGNYKESVIIDLRDHPLEPRLGAYGELHTTEGTVAAGSAYNYFGVVSDARGYVPLYDGAVLAAHARYGAVWGDVPVTERFFAGGAVSQRGFGERRLSPSVTGMSMMTGTTLTVPYGGAGLIDTSVEARVPITKIRTFPVGVAVFVDGADVTETPGELNPSRLHWAAGGGLRVQTPVGPARIDVGYRLNRKGPMDPDPGSSFAYHLTIGEAF